MVQTHASKYLQAPDTLCAGESTTLTASFSDSRWQNYYVEDFELGASSEWSSSSTFSYEGSQLLGRYGNNNIALNLSNLCDSQGDSAGVANMTRFEWSLIYLLAIHGMDIVKANLEVVLIYGAFDLTEIR